MTCLHCEGEGGREGRREGGREGGREKGGCAPELLVFQVLCEVHLCLRFVDQYARGVCHCDHINLLTTQL